MFDDNPLDNFRFRGVAIVAALVGFIVYFYTNIEHVILNWKFLMPILGLGWGMMVVWFKKSYSYSIIEWLLEPFRKNKLTIYFAGEWQSEYKENGVDGKADTITVDKNGNWFENGILRWKIKAFKTDDEKNYISFVKVGLVSHKETKVNKLFIVKNGLHYKGLENGHIEINYTRKPDIGVSGYSGIATKGFDNPTPTPSSTYSQPTAPSKPKIHEGEIQRDVTRVDNLAPTLVATPVVTEAKKTIKDYFSGSWSAVFKVNGKIESRVVHVDYVKDGFKWFENGKQVFEVLGFAVRKDKDNKPILEFHKWKFGNRIECVYTVHSDTLITGDEKNDRWGNIDITFKKIL
jgi:hypothetical protein